MEVRSHVNAGGETTRRTVLNYLLSGSIVGLLATMTYSVWKYIFPPKEAGPAMATVVAAKVKDLPPNAGKIFRFGNAPGIVVRTPAGEFRAFTAVCTHLQCTVQYRSDLAHIWCACHNGHYDLFGKNIAGPPPRPLEAYDVAVQGDDIVVTRKV